MANNSNAAKPSFPSEKMDEYKVTQKQLEFFFLSPDAGKEQKYSHLMDLYDAIPRFHWGRIQRQKDKDGELLPYQNLPVRSVDFQHRGRNYNMTLFPARIIRKDKSNKVVEEWEYYPQVREEIIEDTLRKMASEGKGAFFKKKQGAKEEEQTGVVFTIYSLKNVLAEYGHHYSYEEIRESLLILRRTSISILDDSGEQMIETNLLTVLGLSEVQGSSNAFALFNPLVTRSIKACTFRQYDYKLAMGLRFALSRWLYKRMCFNYTQASRMNSYNIKLSTILRDSFTKKYEKISNNIREIEKALKELQDCNVIQDWSDERIHDLNRKNRIVDVKYTILPHDEFIKDMRKFNAAYNRQRYEGAIE
jgi:hypothetical protein